MSASRHILIPFPNTETFFLDFSIIVQFQLKSFITFNKSNEAFLNKKFSSEWHYFLFSQIQLAVQNYLIHYSRLIF